MPEVLLGILVSILVIILIAGLIIFLLRKIPVIDAELKQWGIYAVYVVAVICIIYALLPLVR